jgi:energy-converting hydrogenase B subunit D
MIAVDAIVCVVMLVAAAVAVIARNLLSAIILVGVVSLLVSYLFLRMGAPDVAMTEAAIGAALSTVVFLIALSRTRRDS